MGYTLTLSRPAVAGAPSPTCLRPGFGRHVGWERAGVRVLCSEFNRPGSSNS